MIKAQISDSELLEHLGKIHGDEMTVFVMADGQFRGAFLNGTRMVNQMRANHGTGLLETMVLGQAILCGALLIPTMKGPEHLTFRYDTNGPAAGFSVEADSSGYVRGFLLQNRIPIEKPLENWDLSPFFGPGTVTVSRIGEGMKAPQTGSVEIMHRNIAKDLAWYFAQSEQVLTAFNTSIQMDRRGRVTGAGGMFLQRVPVSGGKSKVSANADEGALRDDEEELTRRVERAFSAMPSIGKWFADGGDMEDAVFGLFREFSPSVVQSREVRFDCPCSLDYFLNHIRHLPKAELEDIIAHDRDPISVVCHNCGSTYELTKKMILEGE